MVSPSVAPMKIVYMAISVDVIGGALMAVVVHPALVGIRAGSHSQFFARKSAGGRSRFMSENRTGLSCFEARLARIAAGALHPALCAPRYRVAPGLLTCHSKMRLTGSWVRQSVQVAGACLFCVAQSHAGSARNGQGSMTAAPGSLNTGATNNLS